MLKTNPAGHRSPDYRPMTWTTDEFIPPVPAAGDTLSPAREGGDPLNPARKGGDPPGEQTGPTHFEFAQAVLAALRPFPDAYRALLEVVESFWPPPNFHPSMAT